MTREGKEICQVTLNLNFCYRSKKEGKDQESIQSSTTTDTGYQWESDLHIITEMHCLLRKNLKNIMHGLVKMYVMR